MGLTFNLGRISPSVFTDSSLNVGIGAAPSGSYKLEVTGTAKVSSTLLVSGAATFSSSINSGAIQATASGAVIQLIGLASSNAYYVNDQTANSGKRWRFGHTGAVSGYNSFDFYNQTDNLLAMTITSAGNVGIGTSTTSGKLTLYQGTAGNVLQSIVSNQGGSTRVGINFCPSMADSEAASSPAQASIYATDYNYSADIIFANKLTGAVGNALTERMRITSGGDVGIGTTGSAGNRLFVKGSSTSSGNTTIIAQNSASTNLFYVRDDGYTNMGLASNSPYNYNVTFGPRTAGLDAGGGIGYIVSTRESKGNIQSLKTIDYLNQLNPVSFNYRKKNEDKTQFIDEVYNDVYFGFVADEVEMVNKDLVFYDELPDGTKKLAGVHYNSVIAILTKVAQEQQATIQELNERLIKLENK